MLYPIVRMLYVGRLHHGSTALRRAAVRASLRAADQTPPRYIYQTNYGTRMQVEITMEPNTTPEPNKQNQDTRTYKPVSSMQ